MNDLFDIKTSEDFYSYIEKNLNSISSNNCINKILEKSLSLLDDKEGKFKVIQDCFYFDINDGKIVPFWQTIYEDGTIFKNPDIDKINDEEIKYIRKRIKLSKNNYFIARFSHILWSKTEDIFFAKNAISAYISILNNLTSDSEKIKNNTYEISKILSNVTYISLKVSFSVDILKKLIHKLINNECAPNSIRVDCIRILVENQKHKCITKEDFTNLEKICNHIYENSDDEYIILDALHLGSKISQILKKDNKNWLLKEAKYYEQKLEQAEPIFAARYCRQAISLYKKLKINDKVNQLSQKYIYIGKDLKLGQISSGNINITKMINYAKQMAIELNGDDIIKFLIADNVPQYEYINNECLKEIKKNTISSLAYTQVIDRFGHITNIIDSEDKKLNFLISQHYDFYMHAIETILFFFLEETIKLNKLSGDMLIQFLDKNTWYGQTFAKELTNNQQLQYKWIDLLKEPIDSFFKKFKKFVENPKEYPNLIMETDSLTSKIEGIVRDILQYSKLNNIKLYTFDNNEGFVWKNLNNYLKDKNIEQIIEKDDVEFMKYCLVDNLGVNLRNNISHSLLYPQDYTVSKFIMLIIIILKLSLYKVILIR